MTGLEPHPIFSLPTPEQALAMGPERFEVMRQERQRRMELERDDPLNYGYVPEIWNVVDDLLVDGKKVLLFPPQGVDVPKEIVGAPEIWIAGGQRSTKSEYAGRKFMEVLTSTPNGRGWCYADTEKVSIDRQQPVLVKYMPVEIKRVLATTGKFKVGSVANVTWSEKGGLTDASFVLPNHARCRCKNYAQDIANVEGDQLDVLWLDELRNVDLLKTLRYRMGDRAGLVIVTFTSIDENYTQVVNEYDKGSRTVLEVDAELLPIKRPKETLNAPELEIVGYEKVPRVKVAGPGSDGDQRANIVYFHITDNPYYGFTAKATKPGQKPPVYGKERFYKLIHLATRAKILARAYGILTTGGASQFPKFRDDVHTVAPARIPPAGTNYLIVDPCPGRNWFMIWMRIDSSGRRWVYREWPSHGHVKAYIPGHGDLGQWALPGKAADGTRGPAQQSLGWGLDRYIREILRLEGHAAPKEETLNAQRSTLNAVPKWFPRDVLKGRKAGYEKVPAKTPDVELISDRYIDSRYAAAPSQQLERVTTLIEQLEEEGMSFRAASGKDIGEGVQLINSALDYDEEMSLGDFSPRIGRINLPRLMVSTECPNLIYSLREWTGLDGNHGASKDPADCLRYGEQAELRYIGEDAFSWVGGGTY